MHPASFSKDAEDTAGGGNGKDAVGNPSECGTSRNADKNKKRKSEGESSETYEAGNGSKLFNLPNYPEPKFSKFGKDGAENCFAVNQVWATYDRRDVMPRIYAQIKKVFSPGFKLEITWLKPVPGDKSEKDWCDVDLPVACGKFMNGSTEVNEDLLMFSHKVSFFIYAGRNSCLIHPEIGETWAMFRDWDIKWSDNPEEHQPPYQYEFVEVLTYFVANVGIAVAYLGKVKGFVGVFQRIAKNGVLSCNIAPGERYRFSHRIPSFKMTGKKRIGVPEGSFKLDPASLPANDRGCKNLKRVRADCEFMADVSWMNGILLLAYKRANDDKRVTGVHVSSNVPPALGLYKINTNASLDSRKNRMGVGVIIRDPSGEVLGAFAQHLDACFVPSVAAALALLRGIDFDIHSGLLLAVIGDRIRCANCG
ncbi:hypothetical protein Q3G72_021588 [Acer saccharum]|nr:hypothetical protein Q3G72_021588 [Acer saccharum]